MWKRNGLSGLVVSAALVLSYCGAAVAADVSSVCPHSDPQDVFDGYNEDLQAAWYWSYACGFCDVVFWYHGEVSYQINPIGPLDVQWMGMGPCDNCESCDPNSCALSITITSTQTATAGYTGSLQVSGSTQSFLAALVPISVTGAFETGVTTTSTIISTVQSSCTANPTACGYTKMEIANASGSGSATVSYDGEWRFRIVDNGCPGETPSGCDTLPCGCSELLTNVDYISGNSCSGSATVAGQINVQQAGCKFTNEPCGGVCPCLPGPQPLPPGQSPGPPNQ
jgi:hypothetical protein